MALIRSSVAITDVFKEIREENQRLFDELLFANKCLTKLIEFKTFVEFISFKFKHNLELIELKRFEYLCQTIKEVLRDKHPSEQYNKQLNDNSPNNNNKQKNVQSDEQKRFKTTTKRVEDSCRRIGLNFTFTDLLEELREENKRLFQELLFANKCLTKLIEFKTFVEFISIKLKSNLELVELKRLELLRQTVKQVMRDRPPSEQCNKRFVDNCIELDDNPNQVTVVSLKKTNYKQNNAKSAKPKRFKTSKDTKRVEDNNKLSTIECNDKSSDISPEKVSKQINIPKISKPQSSKRCERKQTEDSVEDKSSETDSKRSAEHNSKNVEPKSSEKPTKRATNSDSVSSDDNSFDSDYQITPKKTTKKLRNNKLKIIKKSKRPAMRTNKEPDLEDNAYDSQSETIIESTDDCNQSKANAKTIVCGFDGCKQIFESLYQYKKHKQIVHLKKEYFCDHPNCGFKTY